MSRRHKVKPAVWMDWTPEIAELFEPVRVLTRSMDAPRRVRVFYGLRHITVLAKFSNAEGLFATTKIKIAREAV